MPRSLDSLYIASDGQFSIDPSRNHDVEDLMIKANRNYQKMRDDDIASLPSSTDLLDETAETTDTLPQRHPAQLSRSPEPFRYSRRRKRKGFFAQITRLAKKGFACISTEVRRAKVEMSMRQMNFTPKQVFPPHNYYILSILQSVHVHAVGREKMVVHDTRTLRVRGHGRKGG